MEILDIVLMDDYLEADFAYAKLELRKKYSTSLLISICKIRSIKTSHKDENIIEVKLRHHGRKLSFKASSQTDTPT